MDEYISPNLCCIAEQRRTICFIQKQSPSRSKQKTVH